jgi:hypothetical protein
MNNMLRRANPFVLIGVLTVIVFVLWVGGLRLVWLVLNVKTPFWDVIAALSTAVAAAGVFVAGFLGYRQLSEISSGRHIEVADRLFNELNSDENIKARRWIYQNLPDDPAEGIKTMAEEGQEAIKQVLNSLDRVAFLTQSNWIPDDVIMPWMHPMIFKSWIKLKPYVEYERKRRKESYYYHFAEELAVRCDKWRAKHLPDGGVKWVDDAL